MSAEIILTGSFGVGKSSIFNRFLYQEFNDKYYGTIGVRVNERHLEVDDKSVGLKLWDVAGEVKQDKVPIPYFQGKDVILYVIDVSRTFTFSNVPADIDYLKRIAPNCAVIVVGNKIDLLEDGQIEAVKKQMAPVSFNWLISAKTGEKVEDLFLSIAKEQITIMK